MTVLRAVERERARLRAMDLAGGVALLVAATGGLLAMGIFTLGHARWIILPRSTPFLVWSLVGGVDVAVASMVLRRMHRSGTRAGVAAAIEREQTLRAGALRGVLEVGESSSLGRRASDDMSRKLGQGRATLAPAAHRRARRFTLRAVAVALSAGLLLGWVAPIFGDGLLALLLPMQAWRGTLLPRLGFRALPPQLLRGERLELNIAAPGRRAVTLSERSPGEAWKTTKLDVVPGTGEARLDIGPVHGDVTLVASDGRTSSDTAVVHVTDRPFVGGVTLRATYPSYLGRPPEGLPIGEPARVPRGSMIDVGGRASTELRSVRLLGPGEGISLRAAGHAFAGRFEAVRSGTWSWRAEGTQGLIPDVPLPLELEVVPDSAPRVDLVSPVADTLVAGDDRVTLRLTATDDHGLASVDLRSWREGGDGKTQPEVSQRLATNQSTIWNGIAEVDLAPRGLHPGDALHVRAVAVDNSPWAQRGESREILLKIPSEEERRAMARDAADSAVQQARSTVVKQRALEQRIEQASHDRGERSSSPASAGAARVGSSEHPMSYQEAEQDRSVAKDQRALVDQVKKLQQAASAIEQRLKQAGALDSSLARQLRDAQALLADALTPDLMAQMQRLESAAQQLSGDRAHTALKDLAAMQQRLREQLEKSAEMLKRAADEGAMQTLKDEARDIADRERKLADSATNPSPNRDERAKARELAGRTDRFAADVKKLTERLQRDRADAGASRTAQAREHAEASERTIAKVADAEAPHGAVVPHDQRNQQGDRGDRGDRGDPEAHRASESAAQEARDAASQMDKAEESMRDARESQVRSWKRELTSELDRAIQEMLQMARDENAMEQRARSGDGARDELRGKQSALQQGVDKTSQRLQQEGRKTSLLSGRSQRAMAEAKQSVSEATQSMSDQRPGTPAADALGHAAESLNRAAASLARDRERVNTASSASGFSEMLQQLQEMAKKQGSINAQAQGLMPIPGGQLSAAMQATARQLARQQRRLSQQLDELGDAAGGDRAAPLATEARQIADALEGGRIDATTLARQQQLFRRMLDAGRTLEKDEREDTNRREAKAATGAESFTPENSDATGRAAQRFLEPNWNELRGLTADERRAILDYFKRINAPTP